MNPDVDIFILADKYVIVTLRLPTDNSGSEKPFGLAELPGFTNKKEVITSAQALSVTQFKS